MPPPRRPTLPPSATGPRDDTPHAGRRSRAVRIRTLFIRHLLAYVQSRGADATGLAGRFGVDFEAAVRGGHSPADAPEMELAALRGLADAAAELVGEPDLGVRLSQFVVRGGYQVLDFVTESSPTLGVALDRLIRYQRLINSAVVYSYQLQKDAVAVEHRVPGEPDATGMHGNEYTIAMLVRRCRDLTSQDVRPLRAWFAHPRTRDPEALAEALGTADLQFGTGSNGLLLPPGALEMPVTTADAAMLRAMDHYAGLLMAAAPQPEDLRGAVMHEIAVELRTGGVDVAHVAKRLHLSVRTLQRRLGELGTHFHEVLEEVRRNRALTYVVDPRLATGEVAFLLGYSDPRTFLRAFKRWTGVTPQQYRLRHRASG